MMNLKRISVFVLLAGFMILAITTVTEAQNINVGETHAFTFSDNRTFNGKIIGINQEQQSFQVQFLASNNVYTFNFQGKVLASGGYYKVGDELTGINPVDKGNVASSGKPQQKTADEQAGNKGAAAASGKPQQKAGAPTNGFFNYWKEALTTQIITEIENENLYRLTDGEKEGNNHLSIEYPDFPVDFVFNLVGVDPVPITKVDIHYWNWRDKDKAKDIEVYFGDSAAGPWRKAADYTVPVELGTHTIPIIPGNASYVKLTVKSNYGGDKLYFMEFGIFSNGRNMMKAPPKAGLTIDAWQEVKYVEYDYTYPDEKDRSKTVSNTLRKIEQEWRPWHGAPVKVYTLDMAAAGPKMRAWAQQKTPAKVILERLEGKYSHFFKEAEVIKTNNTNVYKDKDWLAYTRFYPIPPGFYKTVASWQDDDRKIMTQVFYLAAGEKKIIGTMEKVELAHKKCGKQHYREPEEWLGCEWTD